MPCTTFARLIIEENQKGDKSSEACYKKKNPAPTALLYFGLQHIRSSFLLLSTASRGSHFNANNHSVWKLIFKHKICVGRFIWTIMQIRQEMRLLLMLERCCIRRCWSSLSDFSWRWTHWFISVLGCCASRPPSLAAPAINSALILCSQKNMGWKFVTFKATLYFSAK